jgi:hypothetical protein
MASLTGLQVPPSIGGMIRNPALGKHTRGSIYRLMRFDAHATPVPLNLPVVAVRAEIRLVAAIAVPWVVRRLYGVNGDEIGPVRLRHVLPSPREALLEIGLEATALVAVEAVGLLMAIRAVAGGLSCQIFVFVHEKGAVVVCHAGSAMAVPAILQLGAPVFLVVGPGEGETGDPEKKYRGHHYYFQCPVV